jgi:flagella basal body P-ring formation protein FlgA
VDTTMHSKTAHFGRSALAGLAGFLTLAAGVLTLGAAAQTSSRWQPPATIAAAARGAAMQADAGEVETVGVDARLKLAECGTALEARLERPIARGHGTVAVSCSGPSPWRLFVPVRTTQQIAVLVLARNVQAGEVLAPADFAIERRAAVALPLGFLSAPEQAVGFTLRRAQTAGSVLVARLGAARSKAQGAQRFGPRDRRHGRRTGTSSGGHLSNVRAKVGLAVADKRRKAPSAGDAL